jgi:glycosyltransferase involved in cell wall biosynthesis
MPEWEALFLYLSGDFYESGYNFLFISREFIPKGGLIVLEAFKKVKEIEPSAELWIAGEVPPQSIELSDGVHYKGFLIKRSRNKSINWKHCLSDHLLWCTPP